MFEKSFILYDGIGNSVFTGYTLPKIAELCGLQPEERFLLISFELDLQLAHRLLEKISWPNNLEVRFFARLAFVPWGKWGLKLATGVLYEFWLENRTRSITCRGPLATWICLNSLRRVSEFLKPKSDNDPYTILWPAVKFEWLNELDITVWVPGLAAQELALLYQYKANVASNWFAAKLWIGLRNIYSKALNAIEAEVYDRHNLLCSFSQPKVRWQVVAQAMANYLVETWNANPLQIKVASGRDWYQHPSVSSQTKQELRQSLGLPQDVKIVVYSGGCQPWQGIDKLVQFFKQHILDYPNRFLLLLSLDDQVMSEAFREFQDLHAKRFLLLKVAHQQVHAYLQACDLGILLRPYGPVNWVSRPIKCLEFLKAGLPILHNSAVGWLAERYPAWGVKGWPTLLEETVVQGEVDRMVTMARPG